MYKPEDLDKEALQQSIDEIEASEEQRIAAEEEINRKKQAEKLAEYAEQQKAIDEGEKAQEKAAEIEQAVLQQIGAYNAWLAMEETARATCPLTEEDKQRLQQTEQFVAYAKAHKLSPGALASEWAKHVVGAGVGAPVAARCGLRGSVRRCSSRIRRTWWKPKAVFTGDECTPGEGLVVGSGTDFPAATR